MKATKATKEQIATANLEIDVRIIISDECKNSAKRCVQIICP